MSNEPTDDVELRLAVEGGQYHLNSAAEMLVDGHRTVHVRKDFDETIDGDETRHVLGKVDESTILHGEIRTVRDKLVHAHPARVRR